MQKIIGPYEVLEQLGSGGMGVVYRARDTRLHREVAIKVLSETYLGPGTPGQATHERFLREARSASSLNHPNICTIYDVGEQDGKPYLVMELLQGRTLKEVLRGDPLPLPEALEFSIQIARGLEEAHEARLIHRDIKPANIFIVRKQQGTQQAKILDFGLAKQTRPQSVNGISDATSDSTGVADTAAGNSLTLPGSTVGTVAYMSPEQARGEALDVRSDLFSLGSVIYEMATGKLPFPGTATADVFAALLMKEPEPPRKLNPAISKEGERIILRLLAKDKAQRYQTATELRMDLEQLSAARSGSGRTATASSGILAPVRRPFPLLPVAGGVLAIVLAIGGYFWWHGRTPSSAGTAAKGATGTAAASVIHERDSVILSDFANQTGDPVFDTTLTQALEIQLEQSPFLTIVSQQHLRQSLQYLGKPADTKITPEIAREIGIREGIKAIINGSISRLGNQYVISLEAQSTANGDSIASEQAQAADKDHVLTALDQATTALRGRLGESLSSIQKLDTPLGQATTTSLEAFRAYALGDVEHFEGRDIPEAEGHYKRAIELDPNFAMAWARLGVVYGNSGATGKAVQYFQKAYDLSANVSEREKMYIAGHYYSNVTGDLTKVIETLELATRTYPQNLDTWVNLGTAYAGIGDFEKALAATQRAIDLQADDAIARENAVVNEIGLNDLPKAKETALQDLQSGTANTAEYRQYLVPLFFLLGDQASLQQQIDWGAGKPQEYLIVESAAITKEFEGRYHDADALYQKAFDQVEQQKLPDVAASILLAKAQGKAIAGMCNEVPALVKQALSLDKSKGTLRAAGLPAALCGEAKLALPMLEDLAKKLPQDTITNTIALPLTRAADDLAHNRPDQALRDLEPMGSYNLVSQQEYLRGLAYLDLKNGAAAAEAFRKVVSAKGAHLSQSQQDYPQAQLGLARALAMQGDTAAAKQAYHDFFNTWKDADPDLPQLAQAKAEFSTLK
jgi:serine/threonine protein kinase/tetratricopeptide (TPR) repeat protein